MFHIAITENSEFWKHVSGGPWASPWDYLENDQKLFIYSSKSVFLFKLPSSHTSAIMHMVAQSRTPTMDASIHDYRNLIHRLLY